MEESDNREANDLSNKVDAPVESVPDLQAFMDRMESWQSTITDRVTRLESRIPEPTVAPDSDSLDGGVESESETETLEVDSQETAPTKRRKQKVFRLWK